MGDALSAKTDAGCCVCVFLQQLKSHNNFVRFIHCIDWKQALGTSFLPNSLGIVSGHMGV